MIITHRMIGIGGRNVTQQDSTYYNIPVGIFVSQISPYSAAERAGMKKEEFKKFLVEGETVIVKN